MDPEAKARAVWDAIATDGGNVIGHIAAALTEARAAGRRAGLDEALEVLKRLGQPWRTQQAQEVVAEAITYLAGKRDG